MENHSKLNEKLARRHLLENPIEAARNLEQQSAENIIAALLIVSSHVAAQVLTHMNRTIASDVLAHWPEDSVATILEDLSAGVAARLLRLLCKADRDRLLKNCEKNIAKSIRLLMKYPEDSAGALMDPNVLTASEDTTARDALNLVKRTHSSVNDYFYVVDQKETLVGVLSIRALLNASDTDKLGGFMKRTSIETIIAQSNRTTINENQGWSNYHALPVVDRNDTVLGVISYNILRENNEDMLKRDDTPLILGIAEMYWTMLSHLTEAFLKPVTVKTASGKDVE